MPLSQLLTDPTLELVSGSRPPLCSEEMLAGIPEVAVEQARWWERHIVEVLTGRQPGAAPGTRPRPQFDTAKHSLRQRELAKLEELRAAGHKVSRSALQRRRFSYERDGLLGVVDGRHNRRQPVFGRVDQRVVAAVRDAIDGETDPRVGDSHRGRGATRRTLATARLGPTNSDGGSSFGTSVGGPVELSDRSLDSNDGSTCRARLSP